MMAVSSMWKIVFSIKTYKPGCQLTVLFIFRLFPAYKNCRSADATMFVAVASEDSSSICTVLFLLWS